MTWLFLNTVFNEYAFHGGKWAGYMLMTETRSESWLLLYCKVGYKATVKRIEELGVEVFRPMMMKMLPRSDCYSVREVEQVIFPSYLFVLLDVNKVHTSTITDIPGAITFVRFGDTLCVVPEKVIDCLRFKPFVNVNFHEASIECRNIHPLTMTAIHQIADMPSGKEREVALINLIEAIKNS